jgi:hypothetical protein
MALPVVLASPASAVEYTLVKWKKTGQCEVVTTLPLWGDHWVVLGGYPSKMQAETALTKLRRTKACPASKAVKPAEVKEEQPKKKTVTQQSAPRIMNKQGW